MTDNRQFTDGTTIGGVDVYYEDKKLAESTSTTTMTTEGVLLKGTDGAFYEIDKTSLSEVIRTELGAILADNSKNNGTSVGKVPTLNSTGNALGASSVADLASVLGAIQIGGMKSNVDLNDIKETIAFGGTSGATNKPNGSSSYFIFVSIRCGSGTGLADYNALQFYYDLDNGILYTRAARKGFTIFDSWYKYTGTVVQ